MIVPNPTAALNLDFARYLDTRRAELARGFDGRVPNYSFALDRVLRQQINAIGPLRQLARVLSGSALSLYKQLYMLEGVAVGPDQLPQIHALGESCAYRLGIGVPQIYVVSGGPPNAFTIATDDVAPLIVIEASLIEMLDETELLFVIGHECGHIQNFHSIYNTAVEIATNPVARALLQRLVSAGFTLDTVRLVSAVIQGGLRLYMLHWNRCAEITSDRAGLICCGDPKAAQRVLVKLVVGRSALADQINIDAYVDQLRSVALPLRFLELMKTHPFMPRRIAALNAFAESALYREWRPDRAADSATQSPDDLEAQCREIVENTSD